MAPFGELLPLPDHCTLMLAARITLPHFSVSSAMRFLKSAGEPEIAVAQVGKPCLHLTIGKPALISLLSLSMMSIGRISGRADAGPKACLVARYDFTYGR